MGGQDRPSDDARAWRYGDVFGAQSSVGVLFDYRGREHALMVLVDHLLGGGIKDCWVSEGRPAKERLVGLALVVTRDGAVPVTGHTYPGNRPDVTQFCNVLDEQTSRYGALFDAHGGDNAGQGPTVVFDAGQNSTANFAHVSSAGLHFVGSLPPSDFPDLFAIPARRRRSVDPDKYSGLSAYDTRAFVLGADRRVVLTHSPTLHAAQSAGFDQTLAKTTRALGELSATLARGKTRRGPAAVQAEVARITHPRWVARVLNTELTGTTPAELRLTWQIDPAARQTLETEIFGKHRPHPETPLRPLRARRLRPQAITWVIHPVTPKTRPDLHVYHSRTNYPGNSR